MCNVILSYSTKEALEDGVLIAADRKISDEVGILFPVYFTSAAWHRYIEVPKGMEGLQDLEGRLWDCLTMFTHNARRFKSNIMAFCFVCQIPVDYDLLDNEESSGKNNLLRGIKLKSVIGPRDIDDPRPGIFIMMPNED